jgi:hypothetical protein
MTHKILLALFAAAALAGCTPSFNISTPSGFAELDHEGDFGYRAANAEGVVLAVRAEANDPHGDLDFWKGAVRAHFDRNGYEADKAKAIHSADAIPGELLRYRIERDGRPHVLLVAVFVTSNKVVTVEAGGDEAHVSKVEAQLARAIDSLDLS